MKLIPLTQGQFAKVDDDDYELLSKNLWCAHYSYSSKSFYAVRRVKIESKSCIIRMHREILLARKNEVVDHKNHDTLDNQKENIRIVSVKENSKNVRIKLNNTSGFTGVYFRTDTLK